MTKKLIYGSLQLCQVVSTLVIGGETIEIVKFLYKDKDPVYFVFNQGDINPRLIATELQLVPDLIKAQIKNRGVVRDTTIKKRKKLVTYRPIKRLNFIQLKIYKLL